MVAAVYEWLLFGHILAAMVWLGAGLVLAAMALAALRANDAQAVAHVGHGLQARPLTLTSSEEIPSCPLPSPARNCALPSTTDA